MTNTHEFVVFGGILVLVSAALAGCSAQTAAPASTAPAAASSGYAPPPPAEQAPPPATPVGPAAPVDESIYRIKRPGNGVSAGTRVSLGGPTLQVTATSAARVWVQEAGGDGRCEVGDDAVAYRAIVVTPSGAVPALARGQRVEVVGTVTDVDGHRTLADAVVRPVGSPLDPYVPHCERDATKLASEALDAVLVLTAGSTESLEPPTSDGAWSLAPCFGTASPSVVIGSEMARNTDWAPTWYWVTGVLDRDASTVRIEPRDGDDILGHRSNDVCL